MLEMARDHTPQSMAACRTDVQGHTGTSLERELQLELQIELSKTTVCNLTYTVLEENKIPCRDVRSCSLR